MKKLLVVLAVLAGIFLSGCAGGNDMVIHITTLEQLQAMKDDLTADYVLDNDIDASATVGWNAGAGFEPIGWEEPYFTGSFDGQGYKISNLYINRGEAVYVGLFGFAYLDTEIKNLGLENVDITGRTSGPPYKCRVGALVGRNWAKITNCYSTGSVSSVEGYATGGLVGTHGRQSLAYCYSTADVMATGTGNYGYCRAGGLIGDCSEDVKRCYATGSVEVSGANYNYAGGFTGYVLSASLSDCYSQGSVHAIRGGGSAARAGGFTPVNSSGGILTNCYSTGAVSKTGSGLIGGFCSKNYTTIAACFWDTETSGQATSDGGTGKTTVEMKTKSTFTDAGWDFDTIWDIWEAPYTPTYPWLRWEEVEGTGLDKEAPWKEDVIKPTGEANVEIPCRSGEWTTLGDIMRVHTSNGKDASAPRAPVEVGQAEVTCCNISKNFNSFEEASEWYKRLLGYAIRIKIGYS